ncbi:hypothetical protein HK096_002192, partial [Nowakowskiella sp. JEL0078]
NRDFLCKDAFQQLSVSKNPQISEQTKPSDTNINSWKFVSTIDPMTELDRMMKDPRHQKQITEWVNQFYKLNDIKPPGPVVPVKPHVINSPAKVLYICNNKIWSNENMIWEKKMGTHPVNSESCRLEHARENIDHNTDFYFMDGKVEYWVELNTNASKTDTLRFEWKNYMANLSSFESYQEEGFFKGNKRGVVFTAHKSAISRCLKSIRFLRALGCKLPIEVWYLNTELDILSIKELESETDVKVRDLTDPTNPFPSPPRDPTHNRNFQVKSAAILNSDFVEILYLDSDNLPMLDPTFLFDSAPYKLTGAIMWPDFWKTHYKNPIWTVLSLDCRDEWEVEAGQLVIDKKSNWRPMHLAHFMQSHYETYFRLLNGDKDTFRFGFLALNETFYMVPHFLASAGLYIDDKMCGNTMVQTHPVDGTPLFAHMNLVKDLESDGMVEAHPREFIFKRYQHPLPWDPNMQPHFYSTHVGAKDVPCVDFKVAPHVGGLIEQGWFVNWAPKQFFDLYDELK